MKVLIKSLPKAYYLSKESLTFTQSHVLMLFCLFRSYCAQDLLHLEKNIFLIEICESKTHKSGSILSRVLTLTAVDKHLIQKQLTKLPLSPPATQTVDMPQQVLVHLTPQTQPSIQLEKEKYLVYPSYFLYLMSSASLQNNAISKEPFSPEIPPQTQSDTVLVLGSHLSKVCPSL